MALLVFACEQPTGPGSVDEPEPGTIGARPSTDAVIRLTTGALPEGTVTGGLTGEPMTLSTGPLAPVGVSLGASALQVLNTGPSVPSSARQDRLPDPTGEIIIRSTGTDGHAAIAAQSTVTTQAVAADIEVTKISSVPEVKVGVDFQYTITLRNNGPDDAVNATLQDLLPASLSFIAGALIGPPGGVCTLSGTPVFVNCVFGTVAPGAEYVLTLTVRATAPGDISNTATGGSDTADPNPGNNSATAETQILALAADIEVTKVSSVPEVKVGVDFQYTITLRNNGPDDAVNATLQDLLPASLSFIAGALIGPPGGVCTLSGTPVFVNCVFGTVAPGAEYVLTLTVRATAPGDISNTATGGSDTDDPDPENNSATAETAVISQGCSPGFWKNWPSQWMPTGYGPSSAIGSVFTNSGRDALSLSDGLELRGGKGPQGARDILVRAAVAALLNAAHPGVEYPLTPAEVIGQVNAALAGGDRGSMLSLATVLDDHNNLGCPLP